MFAVSNYEEIESIERAKCNRHLIAILFVRPDLQGAREIISDFEYLHYRTDETFSIYAAGYSNCFDYAYKADYRKIIMLTGCNWYYSAKDFSHFIVRLGKRIKHWSYSGEIELLLFQSTEDDSTSFDFRNYVSIDVSYGLKKGYISSFANFIELIINYVESSVEGNKEMITPTGRIRVKNVIEAAIEQSNDSDYTIKNIIRDRHFYRLPSSK